MKIISVVFLFFVSTGILYSCKKHSNPIPAGISVKANNVSWYATVYKTYKDTTTFGSSNTVTFLTVYGFDSLSHGNVRDIYLILQYPIVPKSYNIGSGGASAFYRDDSNQLSIMIGNGVINVTQISSDNVQGTFNLTSDTLTITGEFNVPIQ